MMKNNSQKAYDSIKKDIIDGEYGIGHTISVKFVSDKLSMSRTPVHDALIRLEEERLVKLIPKQGFQIQPISAQESENIYRILSSLEVLCIEIFFEKHMTNESLNILEKCVINMERALEAESVDAWAVHDADFHKKLIEMSYNQRLIELIKQLQEQTRRARKITLHLRQLPEKSTEGHRRLIEALKDGELEVACGLHKEQRKRSSSELTEILKRLDIRQL